MAKTAFTAHISSDNFLNGWKDNDYRIKTNQNGQEYLNLLGSPVILTKEKTQTVKIEGDVFTITRKGLLEK